ncbi:Exonuclease RNase T and DNA polymerase III [Alicyclobacillus hesperidum URH17-3-68]|uniref:DNA polymerase-3 subunit epsilon n=1 Tax=Alicyclobacillus hesperidum TaxID=89784 RepID=A0A1H2R3E2_9BACL|nr:exonuclease domain-containing protein [Alicyclobacillus hesperidum]EJY55410.1 Exonuclease RNase T and DNA polymerase III [Alicyclobacillus hesperidum URH17-3-68]GLV13201.1 hypothetical protein Heshes_08850 [Alicyclobacillus hesperidum]SDW13953.1 DNA polymerase-3 subunit epsilon [Alicyclobacillus hesperidum]
MKWFFTARKEESDQLTLGLVDPAARLWERPLAATDYFVVDLETTGFSAEADRILSVAAACMTGRQGLSEMYYELVRHDDLAGVSDTVWRLTGLTPEALHSGKELERVLRHVLGMAVGRVWIAHHARHELSFLQRQARLLWRLKLRPIAIDTAVVAQALARISRTPTLEEVCAWLGVEVKHRHQADADVRMTAEVWRREMEMCEKLGLRTVVDVIDWASARAMG